MSGSEPTPPPSQSDRCRWGLYVILDAAMAGKPHVEVAQEVIAGGARVIQLRDKVATFEELLTIGIELRKVTQEAGVTFIVNDNPYLAREVDADGVHIGQSDFPADIVREVMGPDKIIGLSTHTKQQAVAALTLPVDYIGVGPVYPTTSKKSEWATVGPPLIRWVRQTVDLPLVAIGGITAERFPDVLAAGADNVAVIRELMSAPDLKARTRELIEIVRHVQEDE